MEATGLVADGRHLAYVDMDTVLVDGHALTIQFAGGAPVAVSHLAELTTASLLEFGAARRRARRAALLQWTGDRPIDEYEARRGDEVVSVALFGDGA